MPRLRRHFVPGVSAHIIKRGNNRAPIFSREDDYAAFLRLLREASGPHCTQVHGYVLMANHIHLLATPERPDSVPLFMKEVGERYSQYFNRTYARIGTPWSGRYKALTIADERYWLTCLRYVEQNPVRARMVLHPADYRWSSYHAHLNATTSDWLQSHPLLEGLGRSRTERADAYRRLFSALVPEDDLHKLRKPARQHRAAADGVREKGSDPGV
jgi:putative transposase